MKSEIFREIDSAKMSFNWGKLKGVSLRPFSDRRGGLCLPVVCGRRPKGMVRLSDQLCLLDRSRVRDFPPLSCSRCDQRDLGKARKEALRIGSLFSSRLRLFCSGPFSCQRECLLVGPPSGSAKSALAQYALFLCTRERRAVCIGFDGSSDRLPFRQERFGIYAGDSRRKRP